MQTQGKDDKVQSDDDPQLSEDTQVSQHEQDAANLAFGMTRQFITISMGGIGFAIYTMSASSISSVTFWLILFLFGLSAMFGLLFLMSGVGQLSKRKSYDLYTTWLRILSGMQILLSLVGVLCLCLFIAEPTDTPTGNTIQIKSGTDSLSYPCDPGKNYTIEFENGKVSFATSDRP